MKTNEIRAGYNFAVLSNSRRALAVGLRLQAERDEAIRLGLQVIPWAPVVAGRFAEG